MRVCWRRENLVEVKENFLYEYGDNIDNKRYYYEVYTRNDNIGSLAGLKIELVLRAIKPFSTIVIDLDKDEVIKILDKKIEKIVEKHYKAHIDYKGEADIRLNNDNEEGIK